MIKVNNLSGGQYPLNKNIKFKTPMLRQGFGREKDEDRADLCLHSFAFSFESGRLDAISSLSKWWQDFKYQETS